MRKKVPFLEKTQKKEPGDGGILPKRGYSK
jgi:hypothetical protein